MPQSPIVMPKMSMTMTEGELISYTVSVGQEVKAGDVVATVATDKVDMEVEADTAGTVLELSATPNQMINVGEPLLILETVGEDLLAGLFDSPPAKSAAVAELDVAKLETAEPVVVAPALTTIPEVEIPASATSVLAMPGARAKAAELGIDLTKVTAASTSGVIQVTDLKVSIDPDRRAKARTQIAKVTMASAAIPQFTVFRNIAIDHKFGKTAIKRTATLLKAWQRTLQAMPHLHVFWQNDAAQLLTAVKVAIAIEAPYGFVTPVISVPSNPAPEWDSEVAQIVTAATAGKIAVANLSGATTSITDLGDYAVLQANVMLIAPQATALSIGSISKTSTGLQLTAGLTLDHRVGDPGDAAKALAQFEISLNEVI
jgi:pyruvate dehydrogenase E2 component (dihydrolipoamide acetyltransferase)